MQDAPIHADTLPQDLAASHRLILQLLEQLQQEQRDRQAIEHRLDQLLRRLYGPKSERFNPAQLTLFDNAPCVNDADTPAADEPVVVEAPPAKPRRKGHGRRELPKGLRRETVVHELCEAEILCPCCGAARSPIGEEVSEKLDCVPASLFVVRHIRRKYGCTRCLQAKADAVDRETPATPGVIATAPLPPSIIAKCSAEPGLLAKVITDKYCDHLPLARQEAIYQRQGIPLSRKTLCDWMAACADALLPLYALMLSRVLASRVIHCDETRVPVQAAGQVRSGRLWIYIGDRDHPFTIYDYRTTKARDGPAEILRNYQGYLHADAANVFDGLYAPGAIVEVGCWAHARRHVYAALDSDVRHAAEGLARIAGLYDIERAIKAELEQQGLTGDAADACTLEVRRRESVPQLASLKDWLDRVQPGLLPKSPMAQAVNYLQRHWAALNRYTTAGFLAMDNNVAERGFRPIGIGRRNWLFAGSDNGGRTAAVLYSMVQTCRRHDLDPWAWLKRTFELLPVAPPDQMANLLPTRGMCRRRGPAREATCTSADGQNQTCPGPPPPHGGGRAHRSVPRPDGATRSGIALAQTSPGASRHDAIMRVARRSLPRDRSAGIHCGGTQEKTPADRRRFLAIGSLSRRQPAMPQDRLIINPFAAAVNIENRK